MAAKNGHVGVVRLLVEHKAEVNAADKVLRARTGSMGRDGTGWGGVILLGAELCQAHGALPPRCVARLSPALSCPELLWRQRCNSAVAAGSRDVLSRVLLHKLQYPSLSLSRLYPVSHSVPSLSLPDCACARREREWR